MIKKEDSVINRINALGLTLDVKTGHLFYAKTFLPVSLSFELIFIRHGETFGNCGQSTSKSTIDHEMVELNIKSDEKRIFQGDVDTEVNQLTSFGKQQALDVALALEKIMIDGWKPDIIFHSPLSRAKASAIPFVSRNQFEKRFFKLDGIKEMSYGSWDNRRICDMGPENPCHLLYLNQHTLIKNPGINGNGVYQPSESFCEVILRASNLLQELNVRCHGKKIVMFSHSMFGAACSILLGCGQMIEDGDYLAFDGKRKDQTSYIMPNATPFPLNFAL